MLFNLFNRRVLVYTAFGNDSYFKIAGKLQNAGIRYSTKSPHVTVTRGRGTFFSDMSYRHNQYDIYVRKEDEHRALEAIHKK